MTVFSDGQGNHFLGDCIYANHNIAYPNIKFLQAELHSGISQGLTDLLTASGLRFRNVLPQSDFNNFSLTGIKSLFTFGTISDTIDDRIVFYINGINQAVSGSGNNISRYSNAGYTSITNGFSNTNRLSGLGWDAASNSNFITAITGSLNLYDYLNGANKALYSPVNWCGVANNESLALYITQYKFDTNTYVRYFMYAGTVDAVNTNFNYYSSDILTKTIFLLGVDANFTSPNVNTINCSHYIVQEKLALTTGNIAEYPIVCIGEGGTPSPTAQWATDFYVFDNDSVLGFPAIGKVRNLLLATGTYTIGKPVKLQGTIMPDNGFNRWLPVGTFAGKTVLMRCYSSVNI